MTITFLGTGAATSFPLVFCRCDTCEKARAQGGRGLRKRSSLLINQDLLIDMGPDIVSASFMYGISLSDVKYCLQTHPHSDHFDPAHLSTRVPEYAPENVARLQLYASRATLGKMSEMLAREGYAGNLFDSKDRKRLHLSVTSVEPFRGFKAGPYTVTAFPAGHDVKAGSLFYSVAKGGFTVLYGTDTTGFSRETWDYLAGNRCRFDIVILDHTYGPDVQGEGHLNSHRFIEHVRKMRERDLLKKNCRVLATHISHEGNPVHPELVRYGQAHGYEIAYDGLVV